jgi:hypothetical protein
VPWSIPVKSHRPARQRLVQLVEAGASGAVQYSTIRYYTVQSSVLTVIGMLGRAPLHPLPLGPSPIDFAGIGVVLRYHFRSHAIILASSPPPRVCSRVRVRMPRSSALTERHLLPPSIEKRAVVLAGLAGLAGLRNTLSTRAAHVLARSHSHAVSSGPRP